jgi:hypothetical protein
VWPSGAGRGSPSESRDHDHLDTPSQFGHPLWFSVKALKSSTLGISRSALGAGAWAGAGGSAAIVKRLGVNPHFWDGMRAWS